MLTFSVAVTIALIVVGVLVSAFFSGTEVAMFGLRRVEREQMGKSGLAADRRALALLRSPRQLIAAVLIGNELVNSVIAVLVLGVVAQVLPDQSIWLWLLLTLAVTMPLMVLLGEVTPKTLALKSHLAWVRVAVTPLSAFVALVTPLRFILQGFAERCCLLLGASTKRNVRDLSQAEFRNLVDAGSAQGQVNARERRMIHRVFEFADKNVGQIMTPRDRMFSLSFELPMARLSKEIAARGFSRVPIFQKSVDNIRGIVNAKDVVRILRQPAASRGLAEILHEPLFVPRATPVKRLFVTFQQKKVHMALVVNEYGKVLGLVTMDDVLSQLFGVLRDEREGKQRQGRPQRKAARTPPSGIVQSDISDVVDKIDPSDISDVRDATGASQIESIALTQSARPGANTGTADVRDVGNPVRPAVKTDGEDGGQ